MAVETRYLRSDTHTINGLNAYQLKTTNTTGMLSFFAYYATPPGTNFDVIKRVSGGGETTIGSSIASSSTWDDGYGTFSPTWSCPSTALVSTDAIKVVARCTGSPNTTRDFITEQLGATNLDAATWTFYNHYEKASDPETIGMYHGSATYNTRITGFTWSAGGTNVTVTPGVLATSSSLPAASVSAQQQVTVAPSVLASSATLPAATVATQEQVTVTPAVLALSGTLPAASVVTEQSVTITPAVLDLTSSLPAPTVVTDGSVTVSPSVLVSVLSLPTPDVIAQTNVEVAASVLAGILSIQAVEVRGDAVVQPSVLSLLASVMSPSVVADRSTTVEVAALLAMLSMPAVSVSTVDTARNPAASTLSRASSSSLDRSS